jgi:hypothetical protein
MTNVKEILQRTPPSILYHYTTQSGLLGIISGKDIWASHTQYLNDASEFRHALDLVKEELSAMESEGIRDETARKRLVEMHAALSPGMEGINVCVCSFSERGDVLSQWRAYGGSASGFAIGFSGEFLREISKKYGWLVPVIYDEREQRLLVRTLLEDVLQENLEPPGNEEEYTPRGGNLLAYLNRYAPILKHKSFMEECEWRIVTRPLQCTNTRFGYRSGASMLVPYFHLPLEGRESLGIQEIVIGPTPHPNQSRDSVRGLLTKHGIPILKFFEQDPAPVTVRCSDVPYRNW